MGNLFNAIKAGAKAAVGALAPGEYAMAGRRIECAHCRGTTFILHGVPAQQVVNVWGDAGSALLCQGCTHVMVFGAVPTRL